MEQTSILFNEPPLVISPTLAKLLGLNEAIILQQMHYWLQKSPKIRDDRAWIYNSINEWKQQFPFLGANTIRRTLEKLIADGIVVKGDFNKMSFDKTSWWAIDYDELNAIVKKQNSIYPKWANGYTQNGQIDVPKMGKPIPETIPETTTDKVSKKERPKFDAMILDYTDNSDLIDALHEFIKMRITIKKPPTNRALSLIFNKLNKFLDDDEKIAILNQSIINNWQDIYPLKTQQRAQTKSPLEQLIDWENENA